MKIDVGGCGKLETIGGEMEINKEEIEAELDRLGKNTAWLAGEMNATEGHLRCVLNGKRPFTRKMMAHLRRVLGRKIQLTKGRDNGKN